MSEGKELILTNVAGPGAYGYNQIFVAGGTNPISSGAWGAYIADLGYTKNSTRTAVFGGYEVLSSPGYPTGTFIYHTDTQGYTWLWNTQNRMAIYPFDQSEYPNLTIYQAGQTGSCPPGSLQVFANWKNQPMTFSADGTMRHFIVDEFGNEFILGAYNQSYSTADAVQSQFDSVVLPSGWTKSSRTLNADLTIFPTPASTGGNSEYEFNQVRDANQNNYFQYIYSESGDSVYQKIPGMAIYAGPADETRNGTEWSDFIHGGTGNDKLNGYQGNDSIYGDDGNDKLYGGDGNDYLFGGVGSDQLIGVNQSDPIPGLGEVDVLTGATGADTFVLGAAGLTYYLDPIGLSSNSYAAIQDFESGDKISLTGNKAEYVLLDRLIGVSPATCIYFNRDGAPGVGAQDDLIAIVQGQASPKLDLNSNSFIWDSTNGASAFKSDFVHFNRLFDPISGVHLFSANSSELSALTARGYKNEGIGWSLFAPSGGEINGLSEVHRLYNPATSKHLLTISDGEVSAAKSSGWNYEGIIGRAYALGQGSENSVKRYFNASTGNHLYTSSATEAASLPGLGYSYEGNAWSL